MWGLPLVRSSSPSQCSSSCLGFGPQRLWQRQDRAGLCEAHPGYALGIGELRYSVGAIAWSHNPSR